MADQTLYFRRRIGEALAYILSRENAQGADGTTLQSSIVDAIHAIDSDPEQTETYAAHDILGNRRGRLQKVRDMRTLFLGENGQGGGLLDQIRQQVPQEYER